MKSNKDLLIERYFENSLSPKELKEFEKLMTIDAEFSTEVDFQKRLKTAIFHEERSNLKAHLQSLDNPTKTYDFRWWYAAAGVVFLIGLSWFVHSIIDSQPSQLYAAYFEPYPNVVSPKVRGNATSEEDLKSKAFHLYDQAQYVEAALAFEKLYRNNEQDYAALYQAISLMASGKPNEAIPLLEQMEWTEEAVYVEVAYWYLALAYLDNQQVAKSRLLLEKVIQRNHHLANPAKQLLDKLP